MHNIKICINIIGAWFIYLMGGFDITIQCLLIVILADYITGVASAIYNKRLSSKVGLKGILKKFSYLGVVALSVVIDRLLGQANVFRTLIIYFFIANDGLSIVENMAEMNIKLPKKLIDILEQLKKEDKEGE